MATETLTTVPFEGANLIVRPGRTPADTLVAMKPLVEGMGLDWEAQRNRIARHPILNPSTRLMHLPTAGGPHEAIFLPLTRLSFFFATIHPRRVKDDVVRERVTAYQVECADALFAHFFHDAVCHTGPTDATKDRVFWCTTRKILDQTKKHLGALRRTGEMRRALARVFEALRRDRKNATVRLQFTVPVEQSAAVCEAVSRILNPAEGEG